METPPIPGIDHEIVRAHIRHARDAALREGLPRSAQLEVAAKLRELARESETHRSAAYRAAREITRGSR